MKQPEFSLPAFLTAFLFTALLSISTLFCIVTAFQVQVNASTLATMCCVIAGAVSAALSARKSWPWMLILALVYAGLVYCFRDEILGGLSMTVETISGYYALAFGTPVFTLGQNTDTATAFFLFFDAPLAAVLAWAMAKQPAPLLALAICVPELVLCLNIVETVPATWALLVFLATAILMLLTHLSRRDHPGDGGRLTLTLLLPTAVLVVGLALIWPARAYERAAWPDRAQQQINVLLSGETSFLSGTGPSLPGGLLQNDSEQVDLSLAGPRHNSGRRIMTAYAPESGQLYLRGSSLATYEDNTWSALPTEAYDVLPEGTAAASFMGQASSAGQTSRLDIETVSRQNQLFTPYYPATLPDGGVVVDDTYVSNTDRLRSYSVTYTTDIGNVPLSPEYDSFVRAHYLDVPDQTEAALLELGRQAGLDSLSATQLPEAVADYVRSCAVYDLDTPRVPEGEDFCVWFLTESKQGYCVHFATATALMLRTMGIPARYVTGYLISAEANTATDVIDADAHAWVEYYSPGAGWLPLESTPAANTQPETDTPQTQPNPETPEPDTQIQPPAEDDTPAPEQAPASPRKTGWLWVLIPLGILVLVLLRRSVLLAIRAYRFRYGPVNRRALALWQHIDRLCRLVNQPPAQEMMDIARKARFSQHQLTREELGQLRRCAADLTKLLSHEKRLSRRLLYRLVYALF